MEVTRFLGPHRYTWTADLGQGEGCSWHLIRRDQDGTRFLAQIWDPRPSDRDLDQIRDTFLARFLDATPLDPIEAHLGFDDGHAWVLQAVQGAPLSRLWAGWGEPQRQAFLAHLQTELAQDPHPRFLHPEAIAFRPGLLLVPRVLGEAPWGQDLLPELLPLTAPAPALSEELPWTLARDLSDRAAHPIRGRTQELAYLKSLTLGFSAPIPMERIVLLQGEEGVGKEQLAAWACAVAEGEGIWVHHLAAAPEEPAGRFLSRLLEALLQGSEADFYASRPAAAKALSLRIQAFGFLTGGRHLHREESGVEPEEIRAALEVMDFATLLRPRLVHLSALDRAAPGVLALVRELVHVSSLPWLLSLTTGAQGVGLKPLIAQLRGEATAALVGVNRLEDQDLRLVLGDILGRHALPAAFQEDLIHQSLGNPGLLQNFLELAQQAGTLAWNGGEWGLVPGSSPRLRAQDDLMRQIFLGRLQRLTPAAAALVRLLALAERPLATGTLARLLGLQGDALEDAIGLATASHLALQQRAQLDLPEPRWRELVVAHTPLPELKRLARALVPAFQEQGWRPSLKVQSLATDEASALASVLASLGRGPLGLPAETRRLVADALALHPAPGDEARLLEHLADALALGTHPPGEVLVRPPAEEALEALNRAAEALRRAGPTEETALDEARLLRKQGMLHLHQRRPAQARQALEAAAARLQEHPLHPEQARLRLGFGRLHFLEGQVTKGIRAMEEGLALQGGKAAPQDQAALMLGLGRALAAQSQFLRATGLLESAQRLLEHAQGFRALVPVQVSLGHVRLAQGQAESATLLLQEALQTARMQGDAALQVQAHLALGMVRSLQQSLGPAMSHLDRALDRAQALGDPAPIALIHMWRARTFAAMGDTVSADHAQFQSLAIQPDVTAPEERGDALFLQAEVARFRSAWKDAGRLFKAAAEYFEAHGHLWRQRLALLRYAQALAREARHAHLEAPEQGWAILENLKGPVEGSGSRWLELEWHRAHALLLSTVPATEPVVQEALDAWSEAQSAARDLQFTAQVLEACAEGAQLLLQRGEKLGARSRMQDAFPSFQQLWTRLPESQETGFLGREDLHRFRLTVEAVGLRFIRPERLDPLVDWTPTLMNLPMVPDPE